VNVPAEKEELVERAHVDCRVEKSRQAQHRDQLFDEDDDGLVGRAFSACVSPFIPEITLTTAVMKPLSSALLRTTSRKPNRQRPRNKVINPTCSEREISVRPPHPVAARLRRPPAK
jgi:hypothetical protein